MKTLAAWAALALGGAGMSVAQPRDAQDLVSLASGRFGELGPAEWKVLEAGAKGVDLAPGEEVEPDDANGDARWGDDRRIRGEILTWACTDPAAKSLVHHTGIWIRAAAIEGEIDLSHAVVPFPLVLMECALPDGIRCRNAQVPLVSLRGSSVGAFAGEGARVGDDLTLAGGFHASGEVRLSGAIIGGILDLSASEFDAGIAGAEVEVRQDVVLDSSTSTGTIRLDGARVGGVISMRDARVEGGDLIFSRAQAGSIHALRGEVAGEARLDFAEFRTLVHLSEFVAHAGLELGHARTPALADDAASWPQPGLLSLDGFRYERIHSASPRSARERLDWLGRQAREEFHPQPYTQLAEALRSAGLDDESRRVLVAREDDRLSRASWARRAWGGLLRATIGYGFMPLRALNWVAGLGVFGSMVFWLARRKGLLVPAKLGDHQLAGRALRLSEWPERFAPAEWVYPRFNAIMFSIDALAPIIDFHQKDFWQPRSDDRFLSWATFLRAYMWFHVFAGWVLSTLFAVGVTGLVRPG